MFKTFSMISLFGFLTISAAYAQSGQPVQANVPFAFTLENRTLSAGNYQLTYNSSAQRLMIRGLDRNSASAVITVLPTLGSEFPGRNGRLVFDCYRKTCYLAQVWQGSVGGNRGLKVLPTARQRALAISARIAAVTIPAK